MLTAYHIVSATIKPKGQEWCLDGNATNDGPPYSFVDLARHSPPMTPSIEKDCEKENDKKDDTIWNHSYRPIVAPNVTVLYDLLCK